MRPFGAIISSATLVLAVGVQPAAASDAKDLAIAFVGHCIQNAGRIDKVEAAANVFNYEELSGEMAKMFAPQDPNVEFKGWIVRNEKPSFYALGISWSERDGIAMSNCVVSNPNIDSERVLEALNGLISLDAPRFDDEETGQRFRIWGTDKVAPDSFVSLADAKKLGIDGGTFSFSSPTEK